MAGEYQRGARRDRSIEGGSVGGEGEEKKQGGLRRGLQGDQQVPPAQGYKGKHDHHHHGGDDDDHGRGDDNDDDGHHHHHHDGRGGGGGDDNDDGDDDIGDGDGDDET